MDKPHFTSLRFTFITVRQCTSPLRNMAGSNRCETIRGEALSMLKMTKDPLHVTILSQKKDQGKLEEPLLLDKGCFLNREGLSLQTYVHSL